MRARFTLSVYIARQYLLWFGGMCITLLLMLFLFDVVELMRRASGKPDISIGLVFEMSLLKLPNAIEEMLPFAALFGGMLTFFRLTRNHELVVMRAAGVSVWQFLMPAVGIALLVGVLAISVFNPVASVMLSKYERLENQYLSGRSSLLALSKTGLWLRQADPKGQSVVHAESVLVEDMELTRVIIFLYEGKDHFVGRIDAEKAKLMPGYWQLTNSWLSSPERPAHFEASHRVDTDLTVSKIHDSFASPKTLSFWDLPNFIRSIEDAGFSALRHRLHWHSLLAFPPLLCAMVLIAATFSLRQSRRGGTTVMVVSGVVTGFFLFFVSDLVFALGLSNSIPVTLAAWTPAGVSALLGLAMLLHMEDG